MNYSNQIKKFILDNISNHQKDIIYTAVQRFGVSRQAVLKHMHSLINDKQVIAHGKTRDRFYELRPQVNYQKTILIDNSFSSKGIINKYVLPHLNQISDNIADIIQFSLGALFQNIRDHSNSTKIFFKLYFNHECLHAIVSDNGYGLFGNIMYQNNLSCIQNAAIELVKGGVTTDEEHHSGDDLNAVMNLFDSFRIESNGMFLEFDIENLSYSSGESAQKQGTRMHFKIDPKSERTCQKVFKKIFDPENKSLLIPINILSLNNNDQISSRYQAKSLLDNIDNIKSIYFDFNHVELIGPAFADELIRIIKNKDSSIKIHWIKSNETVDILMSHALRRFKI